MKRFGRHCGFAIHISIAILMGVVEVRAGTPDFNLPDPTGKRVQLHKLLEKGPVLLDFWATWCKPCIKAMPKLQELHDRFRKQGLTVLGVNEDGPRGQARIRPFLRNRWITFPVVIDGDGGVMKRFQVRGLPTSILISSSGTIVLRLAGNTPVSGEKLTRAIENLFPAVGLDVPDEDAP